MSRRGGSPRRDGRQTVGSPDRAVRSRVAPASEWATSPISLRAVEPVGRFGQGQGVDDGADAGVGADLFEPFGEPHEGPSRISCSRRPASRACQMACVGGRVVT